MVSADPVLAEALCLVRAAPPSYLNAEQRRRFLEHLEAQIAVLVHKPAYAFQPAPGGAWRLGAVLTGTDEYRPPQALEGLAIVHRVFDNAFKRNLLTTGLDRSQRATSNAKRRVAEWLESVPGMRSLASEVRRIRVEQHVIAYDKRAAHIRIAT